MKFNVIICAITAASLGFSTLSLAQDHGRHSEREDVQRNQSRAPRHMEPHDQRRPESREEWRERMRQEHFDQPEMRRNDRPGYYYNARSPEFRRGGHIPRELRNPHYVVTDYRIHRLPPPPRGHQWVQVGTDYVLVAIATGLILNIILSQ